MINKPLVSVIMPAFNAEKYISESIQSVLKQTFEDWELLVIDDGSEDATKEIILSFARQDSRIKYIYQQNGRQGKARNNGLNLSEGKYIAFLDADDLWHHEKLNKQVRCISETKSDVVFSTCKIFFNNIDSNLQPYITPSGYITKDKDSQIFFNSNPVPILTVLAKKNAIVSVGCFSEDTKYQNAEDYHLWLKLLLKGYTFYGLRESLGFYRMHEGQTTSKDQFATLNVIQVLQSIHNLPDNLEDLRKKRIRGLYIRLLSFYHVYSKNEVISAIVNYSRSFRSFMCQIAQLVAFVFGIKFLLKLFIKFGI